MCVCVIWAADVELGRQVVTQAVTAGYSLCTRCTHASVGWKLAMGCQVRMQQLVCMHASCVDVLDGMLLCDLVDLCVMLLYCSGIAEGWSLWGVCACAVDHARRCQSSSLSACICVVAGLTAWVVWFSARVDIVLVCAAVSQIGW